MARQSEFAFQDFTFQPTALSDVGGYGQQYTAHSPNPSSAASSSSSLLYSYTHHPAVSRELNSLAHQFSQQSIHHDPNHFGYTQQSAASGPYHQAQQAHASLSPHRCLSSHQSSVRAQRQTNTRMQCETVHARQLAALLETMAASCERCTPATHTAASVQADETLGEDLEDDEDDLGNNLSYRRSTDFSASSTYVSKPIRARKRRNRTD